MPMYDGSAIDADAQFDLALMIVGRPHQIHQLYLYVQNDDGSYTAVARPAGQIEQDSDLQYFDLTNPDIAEIYRRVRNGTCELRFGRRPPGLPLEEMAHVDWMIGTLEPFSPRGMHFFFDHLVGSGEYVEPANGAPARFRFPGIVEGAERTYYRRGDSVTAPDVRDADEATLAVAGWTADPPRGPHRLNSVRAQETPAGVLVSSPQRAYHRRADLDGTIVALARAWRTYWNGLTTSEQGLSVRRTGQKHFEHAIGRCWADRPMDRDIRVFHEGQTGSRERDAREAEDWMLGNLEQWAHEWGFPAFMLALNEGGNRGILDAQLTDYTFSHVNRDGSLGDRLNNGADGLTEATWDAYQDTHYPAAVRHGVQPMAMPGGTVSVLQGETATFQLELTGGLGPFGYELTIDEDWTTVDENGLVTLAPPADLPASSHTITATATDDLGSTVSAQIVVTVTVLTRITVIAGNDHTVSSGGTVGLAATFSVQEGVGDTTYQWVLISGAGSTLLPADSLTPTFTAPNLNRGDPNHVITWELQVRNNGIIGTDQVVFTITAPE